MPANGSSRSPPPPRSSGTATSGLGAGSGTSCCPSPATAALLVWLGVEHEVQFFVQDPGEMLDFVV